MESKESKFRQIINNPLLLISVAYPYLLVFIILFGFLYINNLPSITQNKIPPILNDSMSVIKDIPLQEPRITSAVDITTLTKPTPEMLDKGKQLFTTTCSSCHGNEGKGDGPAGTALNPKPRNFSQVDGWKNGKTVSALYKTLQEGIAGSGMPGYDYMSAEDRIAIISHVRTLIPESPVDIPADITKLDETYKLSQGTELPGTIPVQASQKILLAANSVKTSKIEDVAKKISALKSENGLVSIAISDCGKAAASLVNNNYWVNDVMAFQTFLNSYLGKNGFNPSVVSLSKEEFSQLHSSLKNLM